MKKILIIEHVSFEKAGLIADLLSEKGFNIDTCQIFQGDPLPDSAEIDGLVVMGGPMGIFDYDEFPWLKEEKQFIRKVFEDEKPLLGVCLGAQLIADVSGAKVYPGKEKEIGVFPVNFSKEFLEFNTTINENKMSVFHWHGDTFDIPEGAVLIASSEACKNQGFLFNDRVLGLQFHLESTADSVNKLLENCAQELCAESKFIQDKEEILAKVPLLENNKELLESCLNKIFIGTVT